MQSSLYFHDNVPSLNYFSCDTLPYGKKPDKQTCQVVFLEKLHSAICVSPRTVSYPFAFFPLAFLSPLQFYFFLLSGTASCNIILTQKNFASCFVSFAQAVNPKHVWGKGTKCQNRGQWMKMILERYNQLNNICLLSWIIGMRHSH